MKTLQKILRWYPFMLVAIITVLVNTVSSQETAAQSDEGSSLLHSSKGMVKILQVPSTAADVTGIAYTYQQPTGNRLVQGSSHLPRARSVDIALNDEPRWLVALPVGMSSVWVTVLADGQIQAFTLTGDVVESIASEFQQRSAHIPPVLGLIDEHIQLIVPPSLAGSPFTHPVLLSPRDHTFAFLDIEGNLVIWNGQEVARLPIHVLADCRPLTDEAGRVLVLTEPSTRYTHGILGDMLEATSITLIETLPSPRVVNTIRIPAPRVIEGLAPIWVDLNGDDQREILVTESDAERGARLVAYTESGDHLATGLPVGRGHRWRHQLVVAPFGPDGETEIAAVLTPHIGGTVEFSRLVGDKLEVVAQVPGYSTHVIGSRNLDMALAGDFDHDTRVELLVPNQTFDTLGAIRRTIDGAQVAWTVPVGGRISTNLAAVQLADGAVVLGVGHEGKMLRVWVP